MKNTTAPRMASAIGALFLMLLLLTSWKSSPRGWNGEEYPLGNGTLQGYVTMGANNTPVAVGVSITAAALQGLPLKMNSYSRCHDVDGNGSHGHRECIGDYETILSIPADVAQRAAIPFRWISVNWNPEGHVEPAPAVYAEPHFDFHFYTWDRQRVQAIAPGPCGELVDCEDFKRGTTPVAGEFLPPGHLSVGAVVPGMGNHLVDTQSPELATPPAKFTRTFIYGAFDGELIFWEPMITHEFLSSAKSECFDVRLPAKFQREGNYPSQYCVRFDPALRRYTVSLEKFVTAAPSGDIVTRR